MRRVSSWSSRAATTTTTDPLRACGQPAEQPGSGDHYFDGEGVDGAAEPLDDGRLARSGEGRGVSGSVAAAVASTTGLRGLALMLRPAREFFALTAPSACALALITGASVTAWGMGRALAR
jgi:hypothetical protein